MGVLIRLCLTALLVVGCSTSVEMTNCEGSFYFDSNVTFDEEKSAYEAARRWNEWVGRPVVRIESSGRCRIFEDPIKDATAIAYRWPDTGEIQIDQKKIVLRCPDESCREALFMHEFGHSFGMGHIPDGERGIMSAHRIPDVDVDFTPADRLECERHGPCVYADEL